MDSCSSWSPKSLSPEALPPLDLILPSIDAEEPGRGFCAEADDDGDGFSSCLSNEALSHLESATITSSFFPATSSHSVVSSQSGNTGNHDPPTDSAKPVQEEPFSLVRPSETSDCRAVAVTKKAKLDRHGAACKVQTSQIQVPKLCEKITALQQLVSPFGKTDTASVLLEAIGYIKFLQDQVHVLSSPYMKPNATSQKGPGVDMDLRSRGLCLVPISCTMNVANSNGADYWISGVSGCSR